MGTEGGGRYAEDDLRDLGQVPCFLQISTYPAVQKSPQNSSRAPSHPTDPWTLGKQAVPGDTLAQSPRDAGMSLAVLAQLTCWEPGPQKRRARPACLGTSEVWGLSSHIPPIVNLSMAPGEPAPPGLHPDRAPSSHPSAQWNATAGPALPPHTRRDYESCLRPQSDHPVPEEAVCRAAAAPGKSRNAPGWGRGKWPVMVSSQFSLWKADMVRTLAQDSAQTSTLTAAPSNHTQALLLLKNLAWLLLPTEQSPFTRLRASDLGLTASINGLRYMPGPLPNVLCMVSDVTLSNPEAGTLVTHFYR